MSPEEQSTTLASDLASALARNHTILKACQKHGVSLDLPIDHVELVRAVQRTYLNSPKELSDMEELLASFNELFPLVSPPAQDEIRGLRGALRATIQAHKET